MRVCGRGRRRPGPGIALRADLLAIGLGIDRGDQGQIFQRRRGRPLQGDAHREVAGRLGLLDPGVVAGRRDPPSGLVTSVDGIDHVLGAIRSLPSWNFTPWRMLSRAASGPRTPGGRQQRLQLEAVGVAVDQRVPGLVRLDQAGAEVVVDRVDFGSASRRRSAACRRILRQRIAPKASPAAAPAPASSISRRSIALLPGLTRGTVAGDLRPASGLDRDARDLQAAAMSRPTEHSPSGEALPPRPRSP